MFIKSNKMLLFRVRFLRLMFSETLILSVYLPFLFSDLILFTFIVFWSNEEELQENNILQITLEKDNAIHFLLPSVMNKYQPPSQKLWFVVSTTWDLTHHYNNMQAVWTGKNIVNMSLHIMVDGRRKLSFCVVPACKFSTWHNLVFYECLLILCTAVKPGCKSQ